MTRSNGWNRDVSSARDCRAMSPGMNEMFKDLRFVSSAILDGEVDDIVEGRRRTDMFVFGGDRAARWVSIAVPSSPAPRTRILVVAITRSVAGELDARLDVEGVQTFNCT